MVNSVIKMTILDAMDKIKTAKSISIALLSSGVHSSASFLGSFLVYLLINWSMKPIFLSFKSPLKLYYNLQLKNISNYLLRAYWLKILVYGDPLAKSRLVPINFLVSTEAKLMGLTKSMFSLANKATLASSMYR